MKKKNNNAVKIEKITDLTKQELAFIAEDLLCEVLDRAAYNNELKFPRSFSRLSHCTT